MGNTRIEKNLLEAVKRTSSGLWDWPDVGQDAIWLSPEFLALLGDGAEDTEWTYSRYLDRIHPDDRGSVRDLLGAHLGQRVAFDIEYRLATQPDEYVWGLDRGHAVWDAKGRPLSMSGSVQNITERRLKEQRLLEQENRLRTIVASEPECVKTVAADGTLLQMNRAGLNMIEADEFEEVQWLSVYDLIIPEDRDTFIDMNERVFRGEAVVLEFRIEGLKGTQRNVETHAAPLRDENTGEVVEHLAVTRDVTKKKRLEAQVRHAQKLESLGVLAGGIAHDFNNVLVGVLGRADLALTKMGPGSDGQPGDAFLYRSVTEIKASALRAADLAKQMLSYAGRGSFTVELLDLSLVVRETVQLLDAVVLEKACVEYELSSRLPMVKADGTEIRQVVLNLITNASEALGDRGGVIRLSTGRQHCEPEYDDLPAGDYVFLEVDDSGCGMDVDTMTKMFDPFYSTKFAGRGLGLAALLGIVRGHKGAVRVESQLSQGTCIRVLLPAEAAASGGAGVSAGQDESGRARGKGMALVIDDESEVLDVSGRMLEVLGYHVQVAADPREGVEVFRKCAGQITLIVLDLTMPHMSGDETLREIRSLSATLSVVIFSGYDEQEAHGLFADDPNCVFLHKPFVLSELQSKIDEVLASAM